jgi:hypothetical protein
MRRTAHSLRAFLRASGLDGVELVERGAIARVRDEAHARALLRKLADAAPSIPKLRDAEEMEALARALARGEVLLVRRSAPRPLDPPDPDRLPMLSALGESRP